MGDPKHPGPARAASVMAAVLLATATLTFVATSAPAAGPIAIYWASRPSAPGITGDHFLYGGASHMSRDGRYVVFDTEAAHVAADTNGTVDVYVRDRVSGAIELVSVATNGASGNAFSAFPVISADGRYVAFGSFAYNLVPGDLHDGYWDIYVRDRALGVTERISVSSAGGGASASSESVRPAISADGRFVAYVTRANNAVPGLSGLRWRIILRDRALGTNTLVSAAHDGGTLNNDATLVAQPLSDNGRYVLYRSAATDVLSTGGDGDLHYWLRDVVAGTTTQVDDATFGLVLNGGSRRPLLSANGRTVVAPGISPVDGHVGVFIKNLDTGVLEEGPILPNGNPSTIGAGLSSVGISADASFFAFWTYTFQGGTYYARMYLRDRVNRETVLLDETSSTNGDLLYSNYDTRPLQVSDDGRVISYDTPAPIDPEDNVALDWDAYVALRDEATLGIPVLSGGLNAQGKAELQWTDPNLAEEGFRIYRWNGTAYVLVHTAGPNTTSWTDPSPIPDFRNIYYVRCYRGLIMAPSSNRLFVFTAAATPTNLQAAPQSPSRIRLTWVDNSQIETGYRIERAPAVGEFSTVATLGANKVLHDDDGLPANTLFRYRVVALAPLNSAPSSIASATTRPAIPLEPTNLVSTLNTFNSVRLNWTDNSSAPGQEEGFRIWRSTNSEAAVQIHQTLPNVTTFFDTGRTPGNRYTYFVTAFNISGVSKASNKSTTLLPAVPPIPDNLRLVLTNPTTILVRWTDLSGSTNPEDGFKLWRIANRDPAVMIANLPPNTTAYTDAGLTIGTRYTYYVVAYNVAGASKSSNKAALTALPLIPVAPTALTAAMEGPTTVRLNWVHNSVENGDEDGFRIWRIRERDAAVMIGTSGRNVTTYADTGLTPGTRYTYYVTAYNAGGVSKSSNKTAITVPN